ncbi:MAG: response regulator [Armatimonadota bacterium]
MRPRKILIIEDDAEIRLILDMALRYSGGFEPILACDGVEGVETARREKPDLILLDALMPRMDGYAACRLIKQDESLKNIPVIFLTAKTGRKEIDRAIRAGACGYLTKPFDPLQLAAEIDRIVEGAAGT